MLAATCAGAVAAAVLASGAPDGYRIAPDGYRIAPDGYWMKTDARFAPPTAFVPSAAVTYDMNLVPAAAWIEVGQDTAENGATTVKLRVSGLKAGHEYGVQVHRKPCAADPAAAGGRYQHRPSTDPADVNADNEVWLDFTADGQGAGEATARHGWGFRQGEASSVVVQDMPGTRGATVGCFTVPFGWVAGIG